MYDEVKKKSGREFFQIVEIDLDFCTLDFGVSPCHATGEPCYQTFETCKARDVYNPEPKSYRFCTARSPLPLDGDTPINAIPSLQSVRISPARIEIDGGLGVRASVNCTFDDHPDSDFETDPYVSQRNYIALERGTFWTKLRARNPFYEGRALRVISGYLVDGEYHANNFETRYYVIESMTASGGTAQIVAKDPLKLADNKRSKAPRPSDVELLEDVTGASEFILVQDNSFVDVGDPVKIRSEIMIVTGKQSTDRLDVDRGQYNTTLDDHSAGDTVQPCLAYESARLDDILYDLLVNYSGIDPQFIPTDRWATEVDLWLPGLLSTVIAESEGVSDLLKELGEQAPHSLYWDERTQSIELTAVKPPPINAPEITMNDIREGSFSVRDKNDMRVSTVQVYFGQFDPTQKLDETRNYRQQYVRIDADSVQQYGNNRTKTIYSRWISNLNKAAAVVLAQRIGRRFSKAPREANMTLDAKDSDVWAGDVRSISHRSITDFTGEPVPTPFQITSVTPGMSYSYTAIEYGYGPELPGDQVEGENVIRIGADINNLDIRAAYDTLFPEPDEETIVRVIQ